MKRIVSLALLVLVSTYGLAQVPPQYVGITSQQFNFIAAAQQEDEWCWAASIQMILNYYAIPVSQQEIVARAKGQLIDQGGSDQDISNSLNGWGVAYGGVARIIRSWAAPGPPRPDILVQELSRGHPILLTFATGVYSGHAVVITAASFIGTASNPQILSLVIRDPWPSPDHVATAGRVELGGMDLSQFIPLVRGHWLVSVQ
jgi:Papain-like cysteine protease AvrRpt2